MSSKGQVVAYLRISHRDQSLDTLRAKIEVFGHVDRIFEETASTKNARAVLAECLAYRRDGDALVVTRADRIARSTVELLATVQELRAKRVTVRFLDQPELNGEGKYGEFLLAILGAVAQLERDIMDE
jgi:DNA invertase Pin-like site-specific DNA recombinase